MTDSVSLWTVCISAGASAGAAIISVVITYVLTRKREHEADWRKLKLNQYQEFLLALSGVVDERTTRDGQRRYADAVNSMALVASLDVLKALENFQKEISYINKARSDERHDYLLDLLLKAMRKDIGPKHVNLGQDFSFHLLGVPPETIKLHKQTQVKA